MTLKMVVGKFVRASLSGRLVALPFSTAAMQISSAQGFLWTQSDAMPGKTLEYTRGDTCTA